MLKFLFEIVGLSAASGLVLITNKLYLIADNSTYLYQYNIDTKKIIKHPLKKDAEDNIPKKKKKDFETIYLKDNKLYILGSGSKEEREKLKIFDLSTQNVKTNDLTDLYTQFKKTENLTSDELNIEGCVYYQKKYYYFQRGNAGQNKNGIFIVDNNAKISYKAIQLPKIKDVELTFTDATVVDDSIYFLAAAEGSDSTYSDGEIFGTWLGKLNFETFELKMIQEISKTQKFEGITLYKNYKSTIQFLLCEDADRQTHETSIYKLSIAKK